MEVGTINAIRLSGRDSSYQLTEWFVMPCNLSITDASSGTASIAFNETEAGIYDILLSGLDSNTSFVELVLSDKEGLGMIDYLSDQPENGSVIWKGVDTTRPATGYYRIREYQDLTVSADNAAGFTIRESGWLKCSGSTV